MVITDTDAFQATITLAESDIILVEVGQKAVITFDVLPDLTLAAKVTEVDDTGSNSQGVVSYSIVVVPETIDASSQSRHDGLG
jgi:multidrug resistance efflux pump